MARTRNGAEGGVERKTGCSPISLLILRTLVLGISEDMSPGDHLGHSGATRAEAMPIKSLWLIWGAAEALLGGQ